MLIRRMQSPSQILKETIEIEELIIELLEVTESVGTKQERADAIARAKKTIRQCKKDLKKNR